MEVPHPAQFAVVKFSDGWRVLAEGQRLARLYNYRVDAEDAALRLAAAAQRAGEPSEVLVQKSHGELRRLAI